MADRISARLTPAEGRKFAWTLAAAFLVLGGLLVWRHRLLAAEIFGAIGVLMAVLGAVAPTRLAPLQRAWMGLAEAISKVTTPIFLSVLYFIVVTPAGLVMRLFGRKPLRHGGAAGFWVARAGAGRGTMHNQF
jgi:uncharacterized membrane protein YkgB